MNGSGPTSSAFARKPLPLYRDGTLTNQRTALNTTISGAGTSDVNGKYFLPGTNTTYTFGTLAGQFLLVTLSPITTVFEVLGNSSVQTALRSLMTAFTRLGTALQPLLNVMANVGEMLLDAFVVQPLLVFVDVLTTIVTLLTEVVKRGMPFLQMMAGMVGLGKLFQPSASRPRSEVSYAQTGTEDAAGTFQRIQQAILKVGGPATEDEKQTNHLAEIEKNVKDMIGKFDTAWGVVQGFITTATSAAANPTAFAQGNTAGAAVSMGVGLLNMFRRP